MKNIDRRVFLRTAAAVGAAIMVGSGRSFALPQAVEIDEVTVAGLQSAMA